MKLLSVISVVLAFAFIMAGCSEKEARVSTVKEVENPPVETAKAEVKKPEAPAPEMPKAPEPKPGKDGFITNSSGLKYKDKKVGKGDTAVAGNPITVHYKGWLNNGKVFDTSRKPDREPFSFTLGGGQVIQGWDEGVQGMKVGGVRELIIPPNLGYGHEAAGEIPPNSTLHFEVELLKVGE